MAGRTRRPRAIGARAAVACLAMGLAALAVVNSPFAATTSTTQAATFVQQVSKRATATSVALQPAAAVTGGDRLVVEVGIWASTHPHASAVTDSAGNAYTELLHFIAADHTELSVWSAPVTAGGGTRPTITVKSSAKADIGAAALEYSGLAPDAGAASVDETAHATATSGASATTVSAGPTAPTTQTGELAVGFYADSGFNAALTGDPTYATRTNVSPTGDMQLLVQDQVLGGAGATPNPTTTTGPRTPWLAATVVFKTATAAAPPSVPAAPAVPSATSGDGQATVSWTPPANGGSPITSYTVTPYAGGTALSPVIVSGATTSATVTGLTNGASYTFTVKATNAIGTGDASPPSNAVTPARSDAATPAFVQQADSRATAARLDIQPASGVATGDRLIVAAAIAGASATNVTDSAGNAYVELIHVTASDQTELSVWSAPVVAGGGTRPTITVTSSAAADIGATVLEYAGLSTALGAAALDSVATGTGTTGSSGSNAVSSGPTAATTGADELALGIYADAGASAGLSGDPAFTTRTNASPSAHVEYLAQDQVIPTAGATPKPTTTTGANATWLAATLVLKSATASAPTAPAAPPSVTASPGNAQATVSWTAPADGGSPITGYTITPYAGATALSPWHVDGNTTSLIVTGLTNGTAYTFTVAATNAIGTGSPSVASNAVTPSDSTGGQWSSLMTWPIVAVHSILLPNGNVLAFDGWEQPQPTFVWDATSQTFPTTLNAPGSVFCAGNALLPDGRVITVGGDGQFTTGNLGLADTAIFDPATSSWTKVADMKKPRWYPSLTELPDGRYVAISGNSTNPTTWADTPEVYDPGANTWTLLNNVSTPEVHEEEYPFSYLAPNGKVFTIGTSEDNSFFLDIDNQTWTPVGGKSGVVNGSSVMYRPGKILYSGGAASVDTAAPSHATSAVIDLTAGTPQWRQVASMHNNRIYHTLTMLADGTVLAVGGESSGDQSVVTSGVLQAEIWNPDTETWTTAASMAAARNYHSTALLMPDGRVLVGGGGHYKDGLGPGQYSAQFYSPPYLFNGPRPTIADAPDATAYGQDVQVSTPDAASIKSVNLVSLGADTHQSDMDQHFVPLSFDTGSTALTVHTPASASLAPPGYYMLFIVNGNGVPSVAKIIHIGAALTAPGAPAVPTATAGDGQATVSWTPPLDGGSPITGYTVTPYIGSAAQTPQTFAGSATSGTITGLTNGTSYTFTVRATNSIGTGDPSSQSNVVTPLHVGTAVPTFVQQVNKRATAASVTLQPSTPLTSGNRLIVETGTWANSSPTISTVTDSAGDTFTELTHFTAADHTELTVWTAPITAGGTAPTITVKATASADIGAAVLEYSGLSGAAGAGALDVLKTAIGTTGSNASYPVSSGATPPTAAAGELAIGFYADSGFGDPLKNDPAFASRTNVSPTGDMELLVQDQVLGTAAATPNPVTTTGPKTIWLAATLVFKPGAATAQGAVAKSAAAKVTGSGASGTGAAGPSLGSALVYSFTPETDRNGLIASPLLCQLFGIKTGGGVTGAGEPVIGRIARPRAPRPHRGRHARQATRHHGHDSRHRRERG